jgi:hypothetical protein
MSLSSKISRRGIAPIDIELSRAVFNIKRRVLFTVDQHVPSSSGANSANATNASTSPSTSPSKDLVMPVPGKKASSTTTGHSAPRPSKPSPASVEVLFNPYRNLAINSPHSTETDDPFTTLIEKIKEGLVDYAPELCDEGENGTYFLRDKDGKRIAVFKSADEEGISSPKRKTNTADNDSEDDEYFKQFHLEIAGENDQQGSDASSNMEQMITACVRNEVAAYALDLQAGHFYSVAQTGIVAIHPSPHSRSKKRNDGCEYFASTKVGSLQAFVDSDGTASDVGPVLFPVKEVHKIGILDLQIFNLDRHLGNILIKKNVPAAPASGSNGARLSFGDSPFRSKALSGVHGFASGQGPAAPTSTQTAPSNPGTSLPSSWPRSKQLPGEFTLTPIDHGYSLPHTLADVRDLWFEWITFPQAKRPFDDDTKQFIESIDVDANARLLRQVGISAESLKIMKMTTTLLKKCARANWTLYDIAMLIVNSSIQDDDEPSALEDLMAEVEEDYQAMIEQAASSSSLDDNGLYLSVVSVKIDDLIEQHQQMLLKQQQFERK